MCMLQHAVLKLTYCPCVQLYEEVCDRGGLHGPRLRRTQATAAPATILLLPPQFSVLNESRLPDLVRTRLLLLCTTL